MNLTYDDILNEMKTAFYNECGKSVSDYSEIDMKFKAVASEIFAVSAFGDYILKQGFVQTANGPSLDRHALLRGITRKKADYAKGFITFRLSEESDREVVIPKGTVCSAKGLPYIQFATQEDAIIVPGELFTAASVQALKTGEEYNCKAYSVCIMVNPPQYVYCAENEDAFTGGCDDECDESLRERILSSYSALNNGINAQSVRETLLTLDDALDACVMPNDNGEMIVCIRTKDGVISENLKKSAERLLGVSAFCGASLEFKAAVQKRFTVNIIAKVLSGYDKKQIENELKNKIRRYCAKRKIGVNISESELSAALCETEGVLHFDISMKAQSGAMNCGTHEYLELVDTTVALYE